jgi:23S rRNA pseudouridine955/2504/2580 synthase
MPLKKYVTQQGERMVSVDERGQESRTRFLLRKKLKGTSLLRAELHTGRTHQIRAQLSHLGFPIAGDDKYGDFAWNRELSRMGLKRMFLHAESFAFAHPATGQRISIVSPLPADLTRFLSRMDQ